MRFGRHLPGCTEPLADLLTGSLLLIGGPGVGKTTLLRECTALVSQRLRVMAVDASNEIAGDDITPNPAVGDARRVIVEDSGDGVMLAMLEAVQNHTPQVIVVDEISDAKQASVARTIARRGVNLVCTCHGRGLRDLVQNSELSPLLGGFGQVVLAASEERYGGRRKTATERLGAPLLDAIVEVHTQQSWVVHPDPAQAVYEILAGRRPSAERRWRKADGGFWVEKVSV